MNAIIYRRVSTDSQKGSELTQDSENVAFCEQRGWPVIREFADPDTSGTIPIAQRKDGRRLLDFLAQEAAKQPLAIVAVKQDRLGRDCLDQIAFIRRVWEMGVLPCLVAEGGPLPRTTDNELKFGLKAVIAQDEVNRIRDRVRRGLSGKRQRGELCGTVPYGWDAVATGEVRSNRNGHQVHIMRLVPNIVEQTWLKQIWQWRLAGWAYNRIAKELNRLGVSTKEAGRVHRLKHYGPQRAASHWQCGNVDRLLKNSYTKQLIEQWFPPPQ